MTNRQRILARMQPHAQDRVETILRPWHSKTAAVRKLIEDAYLDGFEAGKEQTRKYFTEKREKPNG